MHLFLFILVTLVSCRQGEKRSGEDLIYRPGADSLVQGLMQAEPQKMDVSFQIISGERGREGYGYDIYRNGKLYIHQPTIPAVAGNRTFSTEQKAKEAAQLVIDKVRNNILPPTVDVSELDSLHLLD